MPMGSNCEVCGAEPKRIPEGPFAGSRGSHDYCDSCSKDLCDDCMKNGHCRDSQDNKHHPSSEFEGGE